MSNPGSTSHLEEPSTFTDQLHRSNSETAVGVAGARSSSSYIVDNLVVGLQHSTDNVQKLFEAISDLVERVRDLESTLDTMSESKSGGGCGLTCANNSFTL